MPKGDPIGETCFNAVRLTKIDLCWSEGHSGSKLHFEGSERLLMHFGLSGGITLAFGGRKHRLAAGGAQLLPVGADVVSTHDEDVRLLSFGVAEPVLRSKLAALSGDWPGRPLEFAPIDGVADPTLRQTVWALADHISTHGDAASEIFTAEFQESVLLQLLFAHEQRHRGALFRRPPMIADRQLALAFDYIEANWMRPVLVEDIAAAIGTSVRSLFRSFQKTPSRTPMAHLKRVRLGHARTMLLAADVGMTVTGVIYACGFVNTGHFAKDYYAMFGERPSETLAKARRGER